jgi:hypothetical protein
LLLACRDCPKIIGSIALILAVNCSFIAGGPYSVLGFFLFASSDDRQLLDHFVLVLAIFLDLGVF